MSLPDFNGHGDLPVGVHPAGMDEVVQRFGRGSNDRVSNARNLRHIHELAKQTGGLQRFIVFGSFVTAKPDPNDVDVILVMADGFQPDQAPIATRALFDHAVAQVRYNASIF
ncbi:MAG: hypothetical protein ABI614_00320 [Planctomycetota bacterium]